MTAPEPFLVRGLTVQRPWAQLIVTGHKPVEFRSWSTPYRGPLMIHAGTAWTTAGKALARTLGIRLDSHGPLSRPGWLGVVDLVDVHAVYDRGACTPACKTWSMPGQHHWQLANARLLAAPIAGRGRLGLLAAPAEAVDAARAQGLLPEPGRLTTPTTQAAIEEQPDLFGGDGRG
jgi:hypothetical protein